MKIKSLNEFTEFQIKNIEVINGGLMAVDGTCKLTKCEPCPDDPCHDCCDDEEDDDDGGIAAPAPVPALPS